MIINFFGENDEVEDDNMIPNVELIISQCKYVNVIINIYSSPEQRNIFRHSSDL